MADQPNLELDLPADVLPLVPVRNLVLFPGTVVPVTMARPRSIGAAQAGVRGERPIGVVLQREAGVEDPGPLDLHRVGTTANVLRYMTAPDGNHHLICQGQQRFRVLEFVSGYPFLAARFELVDEPEGKGTEIEARFMLLRERALEAIELLPQAPRELADTIRGIGSAGQLADMVASTMDISPSREGGGAGDLRPRPADRSRAGVPEPAPGGAAAVARAGRGDARHLGEAPARGAAARAAGDHPQGAGRGRGHGGRDRGPEEGDRRGRHARGGAGSRPTRSCAGWSACPRPRPSTACCAPISTR